MLSSPTRITRAGIPLDPLLLQTPTKSIIQELNFLSTVALLLLVCCKNYFFIFLNFLSLILTKLVFPGFSLLITRGQLSKLHVNVSCMLINSLLFWSLCSWKHIMEISSLLFLLSPFFLFFSFGNIKK